MIPTYLQGKSAAQIISEIQKNFVNIETGDLEELKKSYMRYLEGLLFLAVKDALMNADNGEIVVINGHLQDAECRAIAFLNSVLPYKE